MRPHSPSIALGSTLEFPGAIYQLTGRGKARQKGFFTDADRELFLMSTVQIVQVVQSFHSVQKVHFGERSIGRTTCEGANSTSRKARGHKGEPPSLRWRKSLEDKGEKAIGDAYGQNIGLMKSPRLGGH